MDVFAAWLGNFINYPVTFGLITFLVLLVFVGTPVMAWWICFRKDK